MRLHHIVLADPSGEDAMSYRMHAIRCLAALVLAARVASGQAAHSTEITVAGGVTTLTSELRQLRVPGGHVQVGLARRMQSIVSSRFQLDVSYHSIAGVASPLYPTPNPSVWIATGSVVKDIGAIRGFRPYLVAGVGTMSIDEGGGRQAHLDLAGGAGIVLPRIGHVRPFIEGRYHRPMTGEPHGFIPLSLGVVF